MKVRVSPELFLDYLRCQYKVYLKTIGKSGIKSDFQQLEVELKKEYANRAFKHLLTSYPTNRILRSPKSLKNALKNNYSLIINAHATIENLSINFDALMLVKGKLASKYLPILFVYNEQIHRHERLLLAFGGLVLTKISNYQTQFGRIIRGEAFTSTKVHIDKLIPSVELILSDIVAISQGNSSPQLRLNNHCQVCIFNDYCRHIATDNDDLSLLKGLSEKEITKLNKKGIFSVTQLSYTFRPRKQRKKKRKLSLIFNPSLQALAIREDKIYIAQRPDTPERAPLIYLDIEGIPGRQFYYLIGLHIDHGEYQNDLSFWANNPSDEKVIWELFLKTMNKINCFTLFHYGSYDRKAICSMQKRYGGNKVLIERLLSSSVNVLSMIYGHIYFPTYSNGLKSIASCLDFKWSDETSSGLQALIWRIKWESTRKNKYRKRLLKYNHEDCLALRKVMESIYAICKPDTVPGYDIPKDTAETHDLVRGWPFIFKRNEFFFPAFDRINKCSYFDYQRDKIYFRTNTTLKKRLNRNIKKRKQILKPNKIIEIFNLEKCPNCCSEKLNRRGYVPHTVIDLKYSSGGVKRWVVKYHQYRFRCTECNRDYTLKGNDIERYGKYGHGLISWAVFENIFKGVSFGKVQLGIEELFKLSISRTSFHNFKLYAADYYESTYKGLLNKIFNSSGVIHVDETPVKLTKSTGYVWVFTNTVEVAFIFRPTREGDFLRKYLDEFKGVLVSDFYGAYDSLDCVQQKCLIHLIRDLNSDLNKVPFDEEFKSFVQDFGSLLKTIVETIDRYGLRKRHLKKHKKDVDKFLTKTLSEKFTSDLAIQYQKRFKKNRGKLFSFLDYDGVSWNNNNAEYAFKHFAVYRHKVNGLFSENGIKAYLVLLSIYQTCQYKQLSFLEFLLSKEKEIP